MLGFGSVCTALGMVVSNQLLSTDEAERCVKIFANSAACTTKSTFSCANSKVTRSLDLRLGFMVGMTFGVYVSV